MRYLTIILAFLMTFSTPVAAQDYDRGYAAYQAGDYATALKEFEPLAEMGVAVLQLTVGEMYHSGEGVGLDYIKAIKFYQMAADQGNAMAQTNLGVMYKNGQGVTQNYAEAIRLYRLAAENGNFNAQNNLANMYHDGLGLLQSSILAHMWYNISSANGHPMAGVWRDEEVAAMTSEDLSKAQAMARECMSSGYMKCGY